MGRAKVLDLIDPLVVGAPPSLQVRAGVGAAAQIRLGLELRARARVHLLVVGAPLALRITLMLTALGRREEGTVGAEDDVAPVVPVPPRVLHPLEVLAHALDRTACGTCVSGVASGVWVDVEAVGWWWACVRHRADATGWGREARFFEPPSPSMKHSLCKQARATVGCSWQQALAVAATAGVPLLRTAGAPSRPARLR